MLLLLLILFPTMLLLLILFLAPLLFLLIPLLFRLLSILFKLFGARRGSMGGMAAFGARCGSRPSADGPGQMRMIHLMQDFLPFHP